MDKDHRVTYIADAMFIDEVKSFVNSNTDKMEIESENREKDPTRLGFDLATVSAVVTLVTAGFYFGELGHRTWKWLRMSKANKVIVQTPLKTVELVNSSDLTEEEVVRLLKTAYEPPE